MSKDNREIKEATPVNEAPISERPFSEQSDKEKTVRGEPRRGEGESSIQTESDEKGRVRSEDQLSEHLLVTTPPAASVPSDQVQQDDRLAQEINEILEEDLRDLYLGMSPKEQEEFREKGEETLSKIRVLVAATKVNAKKIFLLIKDWLKLIPGVNRFFLEQEAKIKADKVLLVSEEEKKRH